MSSSHTIGVEYSLEYLANVVFPWVIGCTGFLKIFLAIIFLVHRKLPRFPGIRTWLASVQIYIGTAVDVLVCFGSLLRINLSYIGLAIVPFIVISFICVLRNNQLSSQEEITPEAAGVLDTVMLNPEACGDVRSGSIRAGTNDGKKKMLSKSSKKNKQLTGSGDVKSGSSRTASNDDPKKEMMTIKNNGKKMKFNIAVVLNNGLKTRVMPEEFNVVVLLAPHIILSVSGMVGDPEHDGNKYDISNLFLFLTCMLQELTLISCGIAPASELLYKASLVGLLLTAHMIAINAFGKEVVLLLLPEVVPPLLWFSLHQDRRTPIINVQKIAGGEHFLLKAVAVAMCGCILQLVPKDESLLHWPTASCAVSGLITYVIVLVLRLWPEKAGFATLSPEEVLELLSFWGKFLLQVAVGLSVFRVVTWLKSSVG